METHLRSLQQTETIAANLSLMDTTLVPRWYVAYTNANHEKRVAEQLERRSVEHFLPVYESTRRWKDRRVKLQMPLFTGYIFVRFAQQDRLKVLQVPGLARLIGFNGQPATLPEEEVEALRTAAAAGCGPKPHPYLKVGRRVKVKYGALAGVQGILVRRKNAFRVVLSIDLIMRSACVEVEATDVEIV
jgi:transcription antitermination factor NusG